MDTSCSHRPVHRSIAPGPSITMPIMEPRVRFELTICCLRNSCITAVLPGPVMDTGKAIPRSDHHPLSLHWSPVRSSFPRAHLATERDEIALQISRSDTGRDTLVHSAPGVADVQSGDLAAECLHPPVGSPDLDLGVVCVTGRLVDRWRPGERDDAGFRHLLGDPFQLVDLPQQILFGLRFLTDHQWIRR